MKGKHAQKNFGAVGAMTPTPLSLKTWGGGGEGWGVLHTRTAPPPPVEKTRNPKNAAAGMSWVRYPRSALNFDSHREGPFCEFANDGLHRTNTEASPHCNPNVQNQESCCNLVEIKLDTAGGA